MPVTTLVLPVLLAFALMPSRVLAQERRATIDLAAGWAGFADESVIRHRTAEHPLASTSRLASAWVLK